MPGTSTSGTMTSPSTTPNAPASTSVPSYGGATTQ
jgi:hypothetical protein